MRTKGKIILEVQSNQATKGELWPARRIYKFINSETNLVEYAEGPEVWAFNVEPSNLENEGLYIGFRARSRGLIDGKAPYYLANCCGPPIDRTSNPLVASVCEGWELVPYSVPCTLNWGVLRTSTPNPNVNIAYTAEPNPLTFPLYAYPYYRDFFNNNPPVDGAYVGRGYFLEKAYVYGQLFSTTLREIVVVAYCGPLDSETGKRLYGFAYGGIPFFGLWLSNESNNVADLHPIDGVERVRLPSPQPFIHSYRIG